MREMKRYISVASVLAVAALAGCDNGKEVQDITAPPLSSAVRFFNFGVNAPGVNFYANTTKMTAITSGTGVLCAVMWADTSTTWSTEFVRSLPYVALVSLAIGCVLG